MNIVLAGMPGSGKTTVSKILGKMLNAKVVDTDEMIVDEYGEISKIFATKGEEYFRNLETQAVKKCNSLENAVISTGGGCLLREENVKIFKVNGKIIFLKAGLETLKIRVGNGEMRPLLEGNVEERLKILLAQRTPIYENVADFTVETDGLTAREVAEKITELIK